MNVREILKDYIKRVLLYDKDIGSLGDDDNLLGPGLLDSLNILQLVHFVESHFNIQIPQQDVTVAKFSTIGSIANYLEEQWRLNGQDG